MISWKLAKVSKALATAFVLGTFLPTNIALASEAEDEKAVVPVTSSSETENELDSVTLAEETNKESSSEFELLDYFVTAERIPTSRWDTPADVTVITAKEIVANHYQSISEAVNHVNGVFFLDGVVLNGTDRTLILVDGRRTNVTPSMKAIERIEIVKGGGSALYGSDAVGGVINIITKKGDHDETTFDYSAGSWHTQRFDITNQGNDGRLGWFISGSIYKSRNHNQKGAPDLNDLLTDHDDNNVTVRLDHHFDDRNSVTFDLMHHSKEYNQYDRNFKYNATQLPVFLNPFSNVANDVAVTYNFKEGVSTPGFLRYFNNYQSWFTYDYISQPDKGHERLQGVDYQNGWELGQHKLIAGLEWHQTNRFANYRLLYTGNELSDYMKVTNSAYYLQDTISLGKKWTLVPGVRFDHNSSFGHQWSPKFAANYRSDEKTKIYATWGRVYQAPGLSELYTQKQTDNGNNGTLYYLGNRSLQPETGHTETIGVEHEFNGKSRINFNLFNSKIDHLIDLHDSSNGTDSYRNYVNATEYKQRGVELSFTQNIDDSWSYDVGYAFIHRDSNVGEESVLSHFQLPKNSYRAGVHYKHGIWKANLLGVMGSSSSGNQYMGNNFAALDFNLSCDVAKFATIYTKFLNFTNQGYTYYEGAGHESGRAFIAGIDCKF